MRDVWGAPRPEALCAYEASDPAGHYTLPFGVVKVGIDTYEDNVSYSTLNGGYTPNGRVTAISMLHESGTGGFPKYGVVPQMPLTDVSPPVNLLDNTTNWQQRVGNDTAQLGCFKT